MPKGTNTARKKPKAQSGAILMRGVASRRQGPRNGRSQVQNRQLVDFRPKLRPTDTLSSNRPYRVMQILSAPVGEPQCRIKSMDREREFAAREKRIAPHTRDLSEALLISLGLIARASNLERMNVVLYRKGPTGCLSIGRAPRCPTGISRPRGAGSWRTRM